MRRSNGSLIAWFAANPVAANLLMLLIVLGGAVSLVTVDKEVFPILSPRQFKVIAQYPGAGPGEIEQAVCIRIEEAIYNLPGIKRLVSEASGDQCEVLVDVLPNHDEKVVINEVRSRIQAIPRLPKGVEPMEIWPETRNDDGVIWVALHGRTDPLTLQRLGDDIQADLARISGVKMARNYAYLGYETVIEVRPERLMQLEMTFEDLADAVRKASVDLPGGVIKKPSGELLLRTHSRAVDASAVGNLVIRTQPDGSRLLLKDVANVKDALQEWFSVWRHKGETAQGWEVYAERDGVAVARRVKAYVREKQSTLPPGIEIATWWDDSQAYEERIKTLLEDGISGFLLVCLVLTLFLRSQVALWAGAGILTSIFGAFWLMPAVDVSLNMLSLFGFLLAMGILVDDAIIIGEAVHTLQDKGASDDQSEQERAENNLAAAIAGTHSVVVPVILAVLVALVAFLPAMFITGWIGQMMRPICVVMILTLVFSLVEALFILPAHLAASGPSSRSESRLARLRRRLNQGLDLFVTRYYRPFLQLALQWRYLTLALFAVFLAWGGTLIGSGHIRLSLQPDVTKDSFWVNVKLPVDAPVSDTNALVTKVENALFETQRAFDKTLQADSRKAGDGPNSVIVGEEAMTWGHGGGIWTEFSPLGRETVSVETFVREWRQRIGDLGRGKVDFIYKEGDSAYDLEFDLGASDPAVLADAVGAFKIRLAEYPGVYDVIDTAEAGRPELHLALKPEAERLGVALEAIASQVRNAVQGAEVHRFQFGRREIKVVARLPLDRRESLDGLRSLPIKLPSGALVPLDTLADIKQAPGYNKLVRKNRQRVLSVQARVDDQQASANALYEQLELTDIPALETRFPGLSIEPGQSRTDEEAAVRDLLLNTGIALVVIYVMIAVPFRSYTRPLVFLLAAPVAWCGGVWAHWLAHLPLSMESLVGMIAASGVVVNDSLVLLDYINEHGESDTPFQQLIVEACTTRFRPILLAFLTNFAGFLPTLIETSEQAQFLIPMTLSLSAGLLVGMGASLILTPTCYVILGGSSRC